MDEEKEVKLSRKHQAFVGYWIIYRNGSKAARLAGYSEKNAANTGSRLLQREDIQEAIRVKTEELAMGADEVLTRLSMHARANISDFINAGGGIDWSAVKEQGHLVKKVKHNAMVNSEIELHDQQAALKELATILGMKKEQAPEVILTIHGFEEMTERVYGRSKDD